MKQRKNIYIIILMTLLCFLLAIPAIYVINELWYIWTTDEWQRATRVYASVAMNKKVMDENGKFPASYNDIVEIYEFYGTPQNLSKWCNYYYVGNLMTNDPPTMPVFIYHNPRFPSRAGVMPMNYRDYEVNNRKMVNVLLTAPWELVRNEFANERDYQAFTNRLKITRMTEGFEVTKNE